MIHMQINSDISVLDNVSFLVGNTEDVARMGELPSCRPFDDRIVSLLSDVSSVLMKNSNARKYPDVVTFAFWIRKASVNKLKERFYNNYSVMRKGRGIAFHIAPSNVPVNFAYSLTAGLLTGNANIVRVPSKQYEQVSVITEAINTALTNNVKLKPYICIVRYERDKTINDYFSSLADVRIIWGGDSTISELRRSKLAPRSIEIAFANRYSLAVIDSDRYMDSEDKRGIAQAFYNDTYLTDQNACTSPRIIIWMGNCISKAKRIFWEEEYKIVHDKYEFRAIQSVNKLTNIYRCAEYVPGCRLEKSEDNLVTRVNVPHVTASLMDIKDNSGFFFEYDCKDIMELRDLCNDKRCQTLGYIGDKKMFIPLVESGIKGVDRIVPVGRTMDFDLIWDGYDLTDVMTRIITIE